MRYHEIMSDGEESHRWPSKEITLKDGHVMMIHAFDDYEEYCISVYATVGDTTIAEGKFDPNRRYFRGVEVMASFQRMGAATAIYNYFEIHGYQSHRTMFSLMVRGFGHPERGTTPVLTG